MDIDYQKLGFKAGIEIHQQLNTKKLFCGCSSGMHEKDCVSKVSRKMRASAGESGKVDLASLYEQMRDREFVYDGYSGEACLVDLDEEPPHPVDPEALRIALGFAKMARLKIPDMICVMRKTVSDGSAVSGFQRTMIAGLESEGSYLETSKGKVKIMQLNLEEDASKIEKREGNVVFYSLSRLGIPLLEIGTDASLKDPAHVKEAAYEIGTLLRSFNVKRGIGTIRQDVNISISGGERIEVKGWQDLRRIEELVQNEVLRQYNLLEIKNELHKRGLKKFDRNAKEVTGIFRETESKIVSDLIKSGGIVIALLLPRFKGLLKMELCPGKTFGRELSEYAKAYGTKGMIHTDEDLAKYRLIPEFGKISQLLKAKEDDLVVVIAEKPEIAGRAVDSVYERALCSLIGIPKETRIPNHIDATSSYARPLPGSHRLYPETDVRDIRVTEEMLDDIPLPETLKDRIARYSKEYQVDPSLAKELISEGIGMEGLVSRYGNIEPRFIARTLIESPKEIRKRYGKDIDVLAFADEIFGLLDKGKISKDAVFEILAELSQGNKVDYSKYAQMDDVQLESQILQIIKENKGLSQGALMGKVMSQLRGKADGRKISSILQKLDKK